jgi:hypothetical protein
MPRYPQTTAQQINKHILFQPLKELKAKHAAIDAKRKQAADRQLLAFFVMLIPLALKVERCSIFIANPKEISISKKPRSGCNAARA